MPDFIDPKDKSGEYVITNKMNWKDVRDLYVGAEFNAINVGVGFFFIYMQAMTLSAGLPVLYIILWFHAVSTFFCQKFLFLRYYCKGKESSDILGEKAF